jgi:hypothetical protein
MYRVFPTFAVLMAIMLAMVWVVGCGEEEEDCEDEVTVKSTNPADGGTMAANAEASVTFEGGTPDADSVTINGKAAELKGSTASAGELGLTAGGTADIAIEWKYCDGEKTGTHTITGVTVTALDETPPEIAETSLGDGKDLEPDDLKETVTITFSEAMDTGKTKTIYWEIEDEKLLWRIAEWSDDNMTVTLEYKSGADIGYEVEGKLVVEGATDAAGNSKDLEVEFNTRAKE